ncbi:DUF4189 domain-containing protein [Roseomonas sp. 18066]|uniref:DUF4189 domain-containing protein n=1 Tax=Roseomonas sp. 18066 TaxID=2681412 RepID=UPI00135C1ECC|nr:DUF4189 domain-containing protein [Roseomonas sp. 18066]
MRSFLTGWILAAGLALGLVSHPALAQTGNPTHDALLARPATERPGIFHQALQQRGNACTGVIAAYFAGLDPSRTAYWDVRCRDGGSYRTAIAPVRYAQPAFITCGAVVPAPAGGPCFQPIGTAPAPAVTLAVATTPVATAAPALERNAAQEALCRQSCSSQAAELGAACQSRCMAGHGLQQGAQIADQLPAGTRFGAVYFPDPPVPAVGFANGGADRLAVNMQSVKECQAKAGRVPCLFQAELVNRCGAVAQAIGRSPQALVMTSDPSTQVLTATLVGQGETVEAAEADALARCTRLEKPGTVCRIVVSRC